MIEPPLDRVRISQAAKDQLIKLKRVTKIDQWNILCRWAFCRSLAEPTPLRLWQSLRIAMWR